MKGQTAGKHVWMFNHYAITPDYPGGTRHFELCKHMARQGYDVVLFGSNFIHMGFSFAPIEKGKAYRIEDFNGLKFTWLKTISYKRNDWRRILNMFSYCWKSYWVSRKLVKKGILVKPDVIIGSTVHPFAALTTGFIARKYRVPFIFEIRDLWPQTFIDMELWKKKSPAARFFKWMEGKTVNMARGMVVLSPATVDYLRREYRVTEKAVAYIPNGVDINAYPRSPVGEAANALKIIYLGGMDTVHNLDALFMAMERLNRGDNSIRLLLYGDGKRKGYFADRYPLPNIQWMGSVKKNQVPGVLNSADVLYLSTGKVYYGSENKLYEYLASGKPVISSVYKEHNDVVEKIGAGISVPPGDVGALAAAVKGFYTMSEEERMRMGEKGRRYAEENHNWPVLSRKLIDMIERVLSEK